MFHVVWHDTRWHRRIFDHFINAVKWARSVRDNATVVRLMDKQGNECPEW